MMPNKSPWWTAIIFLVLIELSGISLGILIYAVLDENSTVIRYSGVISFVSFILSCWAWHSMANLISRSSTNEQTICRFSNGDLRPFMINGKIDVRVAEGEGASTINLRTALVQLVQTIRSSHQNASILLSTAGVRGVALSNNALSNNALSSNALPQLRSSIINSTARVRTASNLAAASTAVAFHGGRIVLDAVGSIEAIKASVKQIVSISSTIDDIVLQTNILALNAAVEAARAGEQGRGFAVVAKEVGVLAKRSALAAQEMKALINASTEQTVRVAKLVGDAGIAMREVSTYGESVESVLKDLASETSNQSINIGLITEIVESVEEITANDEAAMEAQAEFRNHIEVMVLQLQQSVTNFQLPDDSIPAAAPNATSQVESSTFEKQGSPAVLSKFVRLLAKKRTSKSANQLTDEKVSKIQNFDNAKELSTAGVAKNKDRQPQSDDISGIKPFIKTYNSALKNEDDKNHWVEF
jgi:methyl-accepting chemotaxis protein-1 (serine sensor receptor)